MGVTIRRSDGTLVAAQGFAEVFPSPLPNPNQPDKYRAAGSPGYGLAWENKERDVPRVGTAGRAFVLSTDRDLQTGPEPGRIARQNESRNAGLIGPGMQNSFPPDANMGYMVHQQIGKLVQGAVPAFKTIADDAWLPGVFAGNPV
jgi:hypothetical protein